MSTRRESDRRFSVQIPQWNRLDGLQLYVQLVMMLVAICGSAGVLIAVVIAQPEITAWNRPGLVSTLLAVSFVSSAVRYLLREGAYFFTREYVVSDDAIRVEYHWKTLTIPWARVAGIEQIPLGFPTSPLRSGLCVVLSQPVGTRMFVNLFPADRNGFAQAVASCCPRLDEVSSGWQTVVGGVAGEPFEIHRDRWDSVGFYFSLIVQAALMVVAGPVLMPFFVWTIAGGLRTNVPGNIGAQSAAMTVILLVAPLSLLAAGLSVARRRRFTFVQHYVLNDQGLNLKCPESRLVIPFDAIYEIHPTWIVRLLGFSLKPGYRIKFRVRDNRVRSIDISPRDADRFFEALATKCPHLLLAGPRWHTVSGIHSTSIGAGV